MNIKDDRRLKHFKCDPKAKIKISMFSIELIVVNEDIETIREKFRS
jgi:hypothetical protein